MGVQIYARPMLVVDPHPLLVPRAFTTALPVALGELPSPPELLAGLSRAAPAPFSPTDEALRRAVRDLLRHGGFKPTGRSKPASEYLVKAAEGGTLGGINAVVDACNVVSLHSGFPISVVDLDRATAPFRLALAPPDAEYVFNASGQTIDIGGLLCLWDADGPCANAVKDAQRTKTHAGTRHTLSVLWGCRGYEARLDMAKAWNRGLLHTLGAETAPIA